MMPGTTDLLKALYIIPMASSKCRALVPNRLAKNGCNWVMGRIFSKWVVLI